MNIEELLHDMNAENNPVQKESPLLSLQKDLKLYLETIQEVATDILTEGLSEYPIFIAHQHFVKLGQVIIDKDELGTQWTINASTFEELKDGGVIHPARVDAFLQSFKDPEEFMCLLVITPEGANFVFNPYASTK